MLLTSTVCHVSLLNSYFPGWGAPCQCVPVCRGASASCWCESRGHRYLSIHGVSNWSQSGCISCCVMRMKYWAGLAVWKGKWSGNWAISLGWTCLCPAHWEAGGAGDPRDPGQLGSTGRPLCVSAQEATGGESIQCQLLVRLSVYGQLLEGSTLC